MKKISILTLLFGLFLTLNLVAQDTSFGVKAGLNVAFIGGDSEDVSPKFGPHFGAYANIKTNDWLALQPELVYSMQGTAVSEGEKAKYNYLNLPVIVKIYTNETFNFQVGPQVGWLASGKLGIYDVDVDVKDALNEFDLSLAVGFGYDTDKTNISLRYNHGLTDTVNNSDGHFPNQVFQLSFGYKIR